MTSTEHDTGDLPQIQTGDHHTSARMSPRPSGPVPPCRVSPRAARRDPDDVPTSPFRSGATAGDVVGVLAGLSSLLVIVALLGYAIATWLGF